MIFGLENADVPGRIHTGQEVGTVIKTWMEMRVVRGDPIFATLSVSLGTVCFLDEKGAERIGSFQGCLIHGASLLEAVQTQAR
jgi:hypothetical protein